MSKVLLLGGISEARQLTTHLKGRNIPFIYSIQGNVRVTQEGYEVITGGFSQYCPSAHQPTSPLTNPGAAGLSIFMRANNVHLLIDCTHPYAQQISMNAALASADTGIPLLQYSRDAWDTAQLSSPPLSLEVKEFTCYQDILNNITSFKYPFWATGLKSLTALIEQKPKDQQWLFRTAKKLSKTEAPDLKGLDIIHQIGPFSLEHELALFKQKQIDALICKNSGGKVNEAKLKAASALEIPVFLLKRPNKNPAKQQFSSIEMLFNEIITHYYQS